MKKLIVVEGLSGSGKSSFSKLLSDILNLEYIDLDVIAKCLYEEECVVEKLKHSFPSFIFNEFGVNFEKLGEIVFNDSSKIKELENVLYPILVDKVKYMFEKSFNGCVLDGIKIHETELFDRATFKIFIDRDKDKRITSIINRDGVSEHVAKSRDNVIDFSGLKYDMVVDNNGDINDLKNQLSFVVSEIIKGSKCMYAGSFDPFTIGHLELIRRASNDFDFIFVGIGNNPDKRRNYNKDDMRDLINEVLKEEKINNCYCFNYDGYTGEIANKLKTDFLIRGVRNKEDEVSERLLEDYNFKNYSLITKYYFVEGKENVSSTLVRDKINRKESVEELVPVIVYEYLKYKNLDNDIDVNKHSSIRIGNIYIDPFGIEKSRKDAKYIFVTHSHYDHFSIEDIDKLVNKETVFIGPRDVIDDLKNKYNNSFVVVEQSKQYKINDICFETIPSYNMNKKFHPISKGWVGYIININNIKYAILGDSDFTEEVKNVKCDVLFVPIGGTYTMNAKDAIEATNAIKPKLVIPVHYNDIVGNKKDEEDFLRGIKNVSFKVYL